MPSVLALWSPLDRFHCISYTRITPKIAMVVRIGIFFWQGRGVGIIRHVQSRPVVLNQDVFCCRQIQAFEFWINHLCQRQAFIHGQSFHLPRL